MRPNQFNGHAGAFGALAMERPASACGQSDEREKPWSAYGGSFSSVRAPVKVFSTFFEKNDKTLSEHELQRYQPS